MDAVSPLALGKSKPPVGGRGARLVDGDGDLGVGVMRQGKMGPGRRGAADTCAPLQRLTWVVYFLCEVKSVLHFSQVNLMLQLDRECLSLVEAARNLFPQPRVQVNGKSSGLLKKKQTEYKFGRW